MSDTPTSKEEQRAIQTIRSVRGTSSGTFLDFIHFLLDFNIIGYTAAFIIAVSASELFNSIGSVIVHTTLKALRLSDFMGDLVKDLIAFVIVVLLVFFLMYFVIQPIVASREIQEERKVKEVVKAAEEQEIEKTAKRVASTPQSSGQEAIIDSFQNVYAMF